MSKNIGCVVGNTNTTDFTMTVQPDECSVGDLITVDSGNESDYIWARVFNMERFNPFMQSDAITSLARENIEAVDSMLSIKNDSVIAQARILGVGENLSPLKYPLRPGARITQPAPQLVQKVLTGDSSDADLEVGHLIGREDVQISLNGNKVVARHMAILAQTGGGKTVASKRVIRSLVDNDYPVIIFDIHGDYLAFKKKAKELFPDKTIKLYYPTIKYSEDNYHDIGTQINEVVNTKLSDPQITVLERALQSISFNRDEIKGWSEVLQSLLDNIDSKDKSSSVVRRAIRALQKHFQQMDNSSNQLRSGISKHFDDEFEEMPPLTDLTKYVQPKQLTIIYLGGYDTLAQSSTAARVLGSLFNSRAKLNNKIPPFFSVLEEAHNLIPSRREKGELTMPSINIIRRIITEGRKFGAGLLLISQRPSRLDDTTLSQCNSHLILKLTNPTDQNFVKQILENITDAELRQLPALGPGEGIVSGQAIKFTNMVKIKHDKELEVEFFKEDFIADAKKWTKKNNDFID